MAENFDYEKVKAKLEKLKTNYTGYLQTIKEMSNYVNTSLQVGNDSALYGQRGKHLLDLWNNNCSIFENYYYIFEEWTSKVIETYNNNIQFEANYKGLIVTTSEEAFNSNYEMSNNNQTRLLTALLSGNSSIDGTPIEGEMINGEECITIDGVTYVIIRDRNGNIIKIINKSTNETKEFNRQTIEERISQMYEKWKTGEISEEELDAFYQSLNSEEQRIADYIFTGATIEPVEEVISIISDDNDNRTPNNYDLAYTPETTAREMESRINNLEREVYLEEQLLRGTLDNIETARSRLQYAYENGYISEDDYNRLTEQYDRQYEYIEQQLYERMDLYNELIDGHHPWFGEGRTTIKERLLKAIKEGNEQEINACLEELNALSSNIQENISDIYANGDVSMVPLHEEDLSHYGDYGENLEGLYNNPNNNSISNTTLEAGYLCSLNSQSVETVEENGCTVEYYNSQNFFDLNPHAVTYNESFEGQTYSEYGVLGYSTGTSPSGQTCDSVRVVEPNGTIHYFTLEEYNSWKENHNYE